MDTIEPPGDLFDPERWGLPADAVAGLADRLHALWTRFRPCFTTTTRDGSLHAWTYLRGVLTMTGKRTFANIARRIVAPTDMAKPCNSLCLTHPGPRRASSAKFRPNWLPPQRSTTVAC